MKLALTSVFSPPVSKFEHYLNHLLLLSCALFFSVVEVAELEACFGCSLVLCEEVPLPAVEVLLFTELGFILYIIFNFFILFKIKFTN
jgi:hypothetical protein